MNIQECLRQECNEITLCPRDFGHTDTGQKNVICNNRCQHNFFSDTEERTER